MKQKAYIFDIDGTLADCSHRLHFIQPPAGLIHFEKGETDWKPDWDGFHAACIDDKPIENVCRLARILTAHTCKSIFLTGRPRKIFNDTQLWLKNNLIFINDEDLLMREDGDHRQDYQVKREIYEREIKDKYEVVGVFEDRQQCVDMWRSLGLTCFQCAKGDY